MLHLDIQGMGRRHHLAAEVGDVHGGGGGVLLMVLFSSFSKNATPSYATLQREIPGLDKVFQQTLGFVSGDL